MITQFTNDSGISVPKILESGILNMPQVVTVKDFTDDAVNLFKMQFQMANNGKQDIIPIVIDSYGGQVRAMLSMVDIMESTDKPIATIIEGKAMSCGAILFSYGAKGHRYMSKNASLMFHDISGGVIGKATDMEVDVEEVKWLKKQILSILDDNFDKKKGYFDALYKKNHNANVFFNAKRAKEEKLVDHIGIPKFNVELKLNVTFGL
jgi:ATP-dependent Clp endopeptidase proteolytic subunit ClpP